MKIQILRLIIFFCLPISTLFAQKYQPLLEEGKTWDVIYFRAEGLVQAYAGTRFFVTGDTIFQNMPYKILRSRGIYSLHPVGLFVPPFALSADSGIAGLIREDTITKKVYVVSNDTEVLLYDFDLKIGDTVLAYPIYYPDNQQEIVILDSIGLIQDLTGQERQIFYFKYRNQTQSYVEGIGGEGGLLSPFCICFEGGSGMSCVKQGDSILYSESVYGFFGNSCNLTVGTNDLKQSFNIRLYPNPTTNSLSIEGLENFSGTITLYNQTGKIILTQSFENQIDKIKIDIHYLPKGIFFCQIQTEHGIMMQKFIRY